MVHHCAQTCEECPNVKLDREGDYITVDVEKGMKEGQVNSPEFPELALMWVLIAAPQAESIMLSTSVSIEKLESRSTCVC